MARLGFRSRGLAVLALVVSSACAPVVATDASKVSTTSTAAATSTTGASTTGASTTTSTAEPTTTSASAAPTTTSTQAPAATARVARGRSVFEQAWTPFATVGGVTLRHPSSRVELIGFHESNHEGARQLDPVATAAPHLTMETRDRPVGDRTAADVVVDPAVEIRSPVTGTVRRSGTYVLYCDYSDDFVVIEPDDRPGWEVKMLHIDGVRVRPGDRVVAGETVIAPRPTQLPFESQVDEHRSADPAWPHVHVEVVDPSIPDRPSPGGGCN